MWTVHGYGWESKIQKKKNSTVLLCIVAFNYWREVQCSSTAGIILCLFFFFGFFSPRTVCLVSLVMQPAPTYTLHGGDRCYDSLDGENKSRTQHKNLKTLAADENIYFGCWSTTIDRSFEHLRLHTTNMHVLPGRIELVRSTRSGELIWDEVQKSSKNGETTVDRRVKFGIELSEAVIVVVVAIFCNSISFKCSKCNTNSTLNVAVNSQVNKTPSGTNRPHIIFRENKTINSDCEQIALSKSFDSHASRWLFNDSDFLEFA